MENLTGFSLIASYKYFGVFAIVFLYSTGFASIIPGRSVMIALGVLCLNGLFDQQYIIPIAIIASIVGANVGYFAGRDALGKIISRRETFLFISKKHIDQALYIGRRHGAKLIIPSMFVGGFWLLTSVIPGMVRMKYAKFAVVNNIGLILWVFGLNFLGYFGGYVWSNNIIGKSYIIIFVIILIALLLFARRKLSHA